MKMSLDSIAAEIQLLFRKTAKDAWRIGELFEKAKRQAKGTFTEWKREHRFSDATVSRYLTIYRAYPDPDTLADIGIVDALEEIGMPTRNKPKDEAAKTLSPSVSKVDKPNLTDIGRYSWQVDDPDHGNEFRDAFAWAKDPEGLGRLIGEVVPGQMDALRASIARIVTQSAEARKKEWPASGRAVLKAECEALRYDLTRLESLIPLPGAKGGQPVIAA